MSSSSIIIGNWKEYKWSTFLLVPIGFDDEDHDFLLNPGNGNTGAIARKDFSRCIQRFVVPSFRLIEGLHD